MCVLVPPDQDQPEKMATKRLAGPARREHILSVSAELFLKHGLENVSTRMIAQHVGISQPSLYAHFATKEALSEALAVKAFETLEARMQAIKSQADFLESPLANMVRGYIAFALEETAAYRIAFMVEGHTIVEGAEPPGLKPGLKAFSMLAGHVENLQKAGQLRGADADLTAQSIWAAMHGLCALLLARSEFPWAERNALIDHHVELILHGVSASKTS